MRRKTWRYKYYILYNKNIELNSVIQEIIRNSAIKFNYEEYINELRNQIQNQENLKKFNTLDKTIKKLVNFNEEQILFVYQVTKMVYSNKQNIKIPVEKLNEQNELKLNELSNKKGKKYIIIILL